MTGFFSNYIKLLELQRERADTMLKIIFALVYDRFDGTEEEKRMFVSTIRRMDVTTNPDKLEDFLNDITYKPSVMVYNEIRCDGFMRRVKFSPEFKKSLKEFWDGNTIDK